MNRPSSTPEISPEKERELLLAVAKNFRIQAPTPGGTGKSHKAFGDLGINTYLYTHTLERLEYKFCELDEALFILLETLEDICGLNPENFGNAYGLTMHHFTPRGILTGESDAAILQPMIDAHVERMDEAIIGALKKATRGKNDIEQLARLRECKYPGFETIKDAILAKIPEDTEGTQLKTQIQTTFL